MGAYVNDEVFMYIVTGGAGFIGSAMLWRLNRAGITDIMVVDNLGSSDKWKNLVNRRYASYVHRDQFLKIFAKIGHFMRFFSCF